MAPSGGSPVGRKIPRSGYLALALLILLVGLLGWHTLMSIYQDIGRHLTLGRIIWETRSVPGTNLFSYTVPDFPFVNHHWLAEVVLYLGERAVGLKGLIAVKAALLAASFGLAMAASFRRTLIWPALVTGLVSAFIIAERTDVRPEILSFLFLSWYLFVLYRYKESDTSTTRYSLFAGLLWTLPLVQLLWVNSHIYFFMGPFVWLAFLAGKVCSAPNIKSGLQSLLTNHYPLLTAALAAATLANPWFLKGALYPLTIFGNYGYSIVENQSYFFLRAWGYQGFTFSSLVAGFLLVIASFAVNRRNIRNNIAGLILALGTGIFALIMIRNLPLFAFVMLPVVLKNAGESGIRWPSRGFGVAVAVLALIAASIAQGQFYGYLTAGRQFGLHVPEGHARAVEFFRSEGLRGPVFNNFDVGSYLIWKLPEERVFVDGRPEAYPAEFLQETYIRSQEREDVWNRVREEYGINAIFWYVRDITPWSQTFMARIHADPEWIPVYHDGAIEILLRNAAENRTIIERLSAGR